MWDHKATFKENVTAYLKEYWILLSGLIMTVGSLLYRPYGQDMQFLMDFLPVFGGIFIIIGILKLLGRRDKHSKNIFWRLYTALFVLVILWASSLAAATATMLSETQRNSYVEGWDVVVLGVELSAEHDRQILDSRLKSTAYYLNENPDNVAILCGGAAKGEKLTTARYMQDYLVSQGISEDRLILEEQSQTVPEAIANAKAIVEARQGGTQTQGVGLISNEYQIYRGRKYAAKAGLIFTKMVVKTPLAKLLPMNFFIREYFKIVPMWLGR